ncbi:hypothetical protein MJD09_01165, partial [bacterium]|nr:hypothetical protein [bacterium]
HARNWKLRGEEGRGKVRIVGLPNSSLQEFSPSSSSKLEDFWDEKYPGLPSDFSELLVVKGAEVQISNADGGVDKTVLKRFLSNKSILDRLQNRISKTLQESRIVNQVISGPKRGEISSLSELEAQLRVFDRLLEQINRGYSRGHYRDLLDQKQDIENQIEQFAKAKRYLAYTIDMDLQRLKRQLLQMTKTNVQDIRRQLALFKQKEFEFKRKQENHRLAEANSQHYLWLKNAHNLYQMSMGGSADKPKLYLLVSAILFFLFSVVMTLFEFPLLAVSSLAIMLILAFLYLRQHHSFLQTYGQHREIEKLEQVFFQKFNERLSGEPQLLERLHETEEDHNLSRLLEKQLVEDLNQLYALKISVSDGVLALVGERKDPKNWDDVLETVENQTRKVEDRIRQREIQFAKLAVDALDFESQYPGIEFSQEKLQKLQDRLHRNALEINEELQKLVSLKQMICHQTGDDISTNWETVIAHLRDKRAEVAKRYKELVAEIVGKITLMEVMRTLRSDEDSKIMAGLNSSEVQSTILEMTHRYNKVALRGDRLLVSDSFQDFYLSDLSSGAQEQILLALRIGFSCKLMQHDSLFLILDDAFQYSDWDRRPLLIDKVVTLAESGWQIIYFTMDNNIRDLFMAKGEKLGEDFKRIDLANSDLRSAH